MTDVPHFSLPFRFAGGNAAETEQDSLDEIADCCYAILVCPVGFRVELPAFGITDPAFTLPGPDVDEIRLALETWEPRAVAVLEEHPDAIDELVARVQVSVQVRSEV